MVEKTYLEGELMFEDISQEEFKKLEDFLYTNFGFSSKDIMFHSEDKEVNSYWLVGRSLDHSDIDKHLLALKEKYPLVHLNLTRFDTSSTEVEVYIYDDLDNEINVYEAEIQYIHNRII